MIYSNTDLHPVSEYNVLLPGMFCRSHVTKAERLIVWFVRGTVTMIKRYWRRGVNGLMAFTHGENILSR